MRKQNEGYVLPLVLVVMIIMSLIAVGVMSVSLRNLQTQKADIARMQDQYAVQGETEKMVAILNTELAAINTTVNDVDAIKLSVAQAIKDATGNGDIEITWVNLLEAYSCSFSISYKNETAQVNCTIVLEDVITKEDGQYQVNNSSPTYTAYDVETIQESDAETPETEVTG